MRGLQRIRAPGPAVFAQELADGRLDERAGEAGLSGRYAAQNAFVENCRLGEVRHLRWPADDQRSAEKIILEGRAQQGGGGNPLRLGVENPQQIRRRKL